MRVFFTSVISAMLCSFCNALPADDFCVLNTHQLDDVLPYPLTTPSESIKKPLLVEWEGIGQPSLGSEMKNKEQDIGGVSHMNKVVISTNAHAGNSSSLKVKNDKRKSINREWRKSPDETTKNRISRSITDTNKRSTKDHRTMKLSRTKRTLGKFWGRPSGHWFGRGVPRPPYGAAFHNAHRSPVSNPSPVNNWVHFLPELFPNLTTRFSVPFITTSTAKPFPVTPVTMAPLTFSPEFPMTTDSGNTAGYTFSDGSPLTLEPDAETLIPLL